MKVISVNVNGIRAAQRKGFFEWMEKESPDMVCVQELKAQGDQIEGAEFNPEGYYRYIHCAEKKGYSGVAIYCKQEPDEVIEGLGWEDFDKEGRFIEARFGNLSVISLYLPSGSSSEERQAAKFDFLDRFAPMLDEMRENGRDYIICGDWNIAHKNIDLKNWKGNQKNSGFLPEERAWMDWLVHEQGWLDAFRELNDQDEQYTWWSNRGQAWAKNVGWRIDYHIVSPVFKGKMKNEAIYKEERFSDHAPLTIEYDY